MTMYTLALPNNPTSHKNLFDLLIEYNVQRTHVVINMMSIKMLNNHSSTNFDNVSQAGGIFLHNIYVLFRFIQFPKHKYI
jgi:hypothetical protein